MINTPGAGGYVLAWLVSVLTFSGTLALLLSAMEPLVPTFLVITGYVLVVSLPVAGAGILLVHLACHEIAAQRVHVAAAGTAGAFAGALLLGFGWWWPVVPFLATTTALARLAVVPLVWRRRDSARPVARC